MILKTLTKESIVRAYSSTILEKAKWNDRRTLKRYLYNLKQNNLITYDFTTLPINKALVINILSIPDEDHFTQIDIDTIQKIINFCSNIEIKNKDNKLISIDLKEMGIRLFYLYESYYNDNIGYAFPTYEQINHDTGISNIYIQILNDIFNKNKLVIVNYGEKKDNDRRYNNTYIPVCDRKNQETNKEEI